MRLEFIAHALGVKPGDKALEIGCGWGRLSNHLASKGAKVTGVTMSSDQQAYAKRMSASLGNSGLAENVYLEVISSVEMAEHVGIRNYNKFLKKVHSLLADDGAFYLQVAGLPRGYASGLDLSYNHYEDLAAALAGRG
ncbi:Cyclopropane-fatty-acyl-phospholipid synthase [Symbiodinium microadriaticum]|uniref:sphingolipid C(9)-methyltransferase n=1 Tax=Symbiodinium microadriaticum TaxID=2951 RepID=A0A1Q9CGS9_SYMMI|nr:Cyclopropane-fatty-acyl-phospholipid synthase [Symbiodinium microadriaticum]